MIESPGRSVTPVVVVAAGSQKDAVGLALSAIGLGDAPSVPSPIAVVAANERTASDGGLAQIVRASAAPDRAVWIAIPERLSRAIWRLVDRSADRGISVDAGLSGERASSIKLPATIAGAATVVAVNDLRGETAERPVIALGIWPRFAGLRARIGVRMAKPEDGLAAEVAVAVRPALVVLAASWRERSLVVATTDQVAAELVGLAIRQSTRDGDEEEVGPWQDPLVQRATDLDLGVRIPDQIAIRAILIESDCRGSGDDFREFVTAFSARLGVRAAVVECVESAAVSRSGLGDDAGGLL
jgi:hypothetical protein